MSEKVEDLTVTYLEGDLEKVKEIDKVILSKGAWATIIFRYQEWDAKLEGYGPDKFSIRRYQKRNGRYTPQSKFTISSKDQAEKIISALNGWLDKGG